MIQKNKINIMHSHKDDRPKSSNGNCYQFLGRDLTKQFLSKYGGVEVKVIEYITEDIIYRICNLYQINDLVVAYEVYDVLEILTLLEKYKSIQNKITWLIVTTISSTHDLLNGYDYHKIPIVIIPDEIFLTYPGLRENEIEYDNGNFIIKRKKINQNKKPIMSEQYYLKTDNGTTVPKFKHHDIQDAITEAYRLKRVTSCKKVEILQVVGFIEDVEVPVTRTEEKLTLLKPIETKDDLPF